MNIIGTATLHRAVFSYTDVDPMTVSAMWVEENWDMFEFGAAAQQSDRVMTTHKDPMGFMDGSRRMSQENIRKLCPEGDNTLSSCTVESFSLILTQGVVIF